ncbi:hypothetical protein RCL1_001948 [Eukaryota sp. TZLM3-RCL]
MSMFEILQKAQQADQPDVQKQAEATLEQMKAQNPTQYITSLAAELTNDQRPGPIRAIAGLTLKNAIDTTSNPQNASLWLNLPIDHRNNIKNTVFRTLGSTDTNARLATSQVLAKLALIELPQNLWPDLIKHLVDGSTHPEEYLRSAVLQTLGYVCESISPSVLASHSDTILLGICNGLRPEEPSLTVKLAACDALMNSLEFISANMDRPEQRQFLLTQLFSVVQSPNPDVKTKGLMVINKLATMYYDKLEPFMGQIYELTSAAIQSQNEGVAKQGIEFWTTIAAIEEQLHEEAHLHVGSTSSEHVSFEFIRRVLSWIVPIILQSLTRTEEYVEEEDWTVALTAATCLEHLSACVGDDIVDHVAPFSSSNIQNQDWKFRDAAIMAFGSIMDGPTASKLEPLVNGAIPFLLNSLRDSVLVVKESAVWALGQICLFMGDSVKDKWLPPLMNALLSMLQEVPRVASGACWAIYNFAESFEALKDQPNHSLSLFTERIINDLLQCSARADGDQHNLRISAYEALNNVILFSAVDSLPFISRLVAPLLDRMRQTFSTQALTGADKDALFELQSHLCGLFHALCTRLKRDIAPHGDSIMTCFLEVLKYPHKIVFEEVLMAVGALANAIGENFDVYMQAFGPHLLSGFNPDHPVRVLALSIGAAGDVARALDTKFIPYFQVFYSAAITLLRAPTTERILRPMLLSLLGDFALVTGGAYEPCIKETMDLVAAAQSIEITDAEDEDQIDFVNSLRSAVFDVYTGLLQGLKPEKKGGLLLPFCDNMFQYIVHVYSDKHISDAVLASAVSLIGDAGSVLGPSIATIVNHPSIVDIIKKTKQSHDEDVRDAAKWAFDVCSKLKNIR